MAVNKLTIILGSLLGACALGIGLVVAWPKVPEVRSQDTLNFDNRANRANATRAERELPEPIYYQRPQAESKPSEQVSGEQQLSGEEPSYAEPSYDQTEEYSEEPEQTPEEKQRQHEEDMERRRQWESGEHHGGDPDLSGYALGGGDSAKPLPRRKPGQPERYSVGGRRGRR